MRRCNPRDAEVAGYVRLHRMIRRGAAYGPLAGAATGEGSFSIPRRPIPRRLHGLARFVLTRGGEYGFMPSLSGLRWLAELGGDGR